MKPVMLRCIRKRLWLAGILFAVLAEQPGVQAGLVADPISIDFGDVPLVRTGDTVDVGIPFFVEVPVWVTNAGDVPVDIISVAAGTDPEFRVIEENCGRLGPGDVCRMLVRYAPRAAGGHSAILTVRASSGEELLVPLWGDAVELFFEGSELQAPVASFGAARPGSAKVRTFGLVNETGGDLMVSGRLEGSEAFSATFPPLGDILPHGGQAKATVTSTYSGSPGGRKGTLAFNVPTPMLPVIREVQIPLFAEVVGCLDVLRSAALPRERARALKKIKEPIALLGRARATELGVSRHVVLAAGLSGKSVSACSVTDDGTTTPKMGAWSGSPDLLDAGEILALAPILKAQPIDTAGTSLPMARRLKSRVLAVGREKAALWDPTEGLIRAIDLDHRFGGILVPSAVLQGRAYAVLYKKWEEAPRLGMMTDVDRYSNTFAYQGSELVVRSRELPAVAGRKAVEVYCMGAVGKIGKEKEWLSSRRERIVLVAAFEHGDIRKPYILLGSVSADPAKKELELEARLELPPSREATSIAVRKKKEEKEVWDGSGEEILAVLGTRQGRLVGYRARRDAEGVWSWSRKRDLTLSLEGPVEKLLWKGIEVYAAGAVTRDLLAASRKKIYLLETNGRGFELVGEYSGDNLAWVAMGLPPYTLPGRSLPLYVLEKRNDGSAFVSLLAECIRESPTDGVSRRNTKPVLLTGDCTFFAQKKEEEERARVTLQAHAFHPAGKALFYSWTAPGIEFDDPTSPTPTGLFPAGETVVYVVVRDGLADAADTQESDLRVVRVVVSSLPTFAACGDANADGKLDISDAVWVLAHLFMGGPAPASLAASDTNGDGTLDISDPIYLLGYLFLGGPAPVCPAGA